MAPTQQEEGKGHVLVGPSVATTSLGDLEYSVHRVPRTHRDDIQSVFPKADCEALRIVPTCQRAREDLVKVGEEIEAEKDRLLLVVSGRPPLGPTGGQTHGHTQAN